LTKPSGDKTPSAAPRNAVKLNARSLLTLLSEDLPQSWQAITAALGAKAPHEIKRARQLLKGLIRQGEITELDGRQYALAKKPANNQGQGNVPRAPGTEAQIDSLQGAVQGAEQGEVTGYGGKLTVDGMPIIRSQDRRKDMPAARLGDTVVYHRVEQASGAGALVLSISQRSSRPVVGILKQRGRYPHVEPIARSFEGRISLPEGTGTAVQGDAVRVEITDHDRFGPVGRILDVMPNASVVAQAIEATLESLSIPRHWPDAVPRAAQRLPKQVDPKQHQDRRDITQLPLVTIDGATAKDFDDAVFAQSLGGQKGLAAGGSHRRCC
jgi:exoribonuclease R